MGRKPIPLNPDGTRNCTGCGLPFPLTAEYWHAATSKSTGLRNQCKTCVSAYAKNNRPAYNRRRRLWVLQHPEKAATAKKIHQQTLRVRVLIKYSGNPPHCVCCGEASLPFLTIDHTNGDGAEHRKASGLGRGGSSLYQWLHTNGYPTGFQVLCYNCNCAKSARTACPHAHYTPHLSPTDLAAIVARAEELERAAG
jgi:hypothetical protein